MFRNELDTILKALLPQKRIRAAEQLNAMIRKYQKKKNK